MTDIDFSSPAFAELNHLTRARTAFGSFKQLLDAEGGYIPSFPYRSEKNTIRAKQLYALAVAYDTFQALRGDPRRAFIS